MIRPASLASLALCVGLGFGLFKVKYQVQSLEGDLVAVDRQIADDQAQMHVLNAEWSYLTQPVRLGNLAARHLQLQPLTAAQIGSFDTLPLKGDEASPAGAAPQGPAADVPVAEVLKAMQVAAGGPAAVSRGVPIASAKAGGVE